MTREDVKKIFPNATEEEITAILNAHHNSIPKPSVNDDELTELRNKAKKYDEYEADKLSSEEKVKKALEEAEQLKSANLKMLNRTKGLEELVKGGFTADEAEKFIDSLVTDNEESTLSNVKNIVDVYKIKSEALVKTAKENFMKNTPKPDNEGEGGNPTPDKTEAEKIAERISTKQAESNKASQAALTYYTGGK